MGSCWACSACTLVNKDDALCCECCGFVKQPPEGTSEQQQQGRDVVCIDDDGDTDAEAGEQTPAPSTQYDQAQLGSQQGLYVLDCGCHCMLVTLPNRLINQAQQHVLKPQVALQHAVQNLTCPQCGKLVSNADAYKLLGASCLSQVYAALVRHASQASHSPGDSSSAVSSSGEAAAACSKALQLWEQLQLLQRVMLGGDSDGGNPPSAGAGRRSGGASSSSKAGSGSKGSSKASSKGKGRSEGSSAWAAGTGYGGSAGGLNAQAHKDMSAAAKRQDAQDTAVRQHLNNIAHLIIGAPLASAGGGGGAAGPAGPFSSVPGKGRKRRRQEQQDEIEDQGGVVALPPAAAGAAAAAGRAALSLVCCAVLLGGPLAWLLRLLLSNDSLMDVGGRQELYREAMQLINLIGSNTDLLPLLELPADDPRDATPATAGSSSSGRLTLMSALTRLDQQAKLFRKSAEQLMQEEGDQDTMQAVCLALDLSSLVEDVRHSSSMFNATLAAEKGVIQFQPISAVAATGSALAVAAAAPAAAATPTRHSRGPQPQPAATRAGAAASNAPQPSAGAAAAAAAVEAQYVAALQPHQFVEAQLLTSSRHAHYFKEAAQKQTAAGGEVMRRRLRRITEELGSLSTSLPLSGDSSVLLAVDAERMDVLRALLLPHPDTPYGNGAFLFDILLPDSYPDKPPKVQFLTTGGGRVRFNPNLYECGKVCLSLLGTWAGPSWEPHVSTLLQVLVSLQSMVFVADPYFNEPGYESNAKTSRGQQQSTKYNQNLRLQTARYGILDALRSPDPAFKPALQLHFSLKSQSVLDMLSRWVAEAGGEKRQLEDVVKQIKAELQKLPPPQPVAAAAAAAAQPTAEPQQQQQQEQRPSQRRSRGTVGDTNGAAAGSMPGNTVAVHDEEVIDLT